MPSIPQVENDRAEAKLLDVWLLRTTLGILGMSLPIVLYLGALFLFDTGLQNSLSSYYHTGMGDCFVGILWVIGILLFAYEGYNLRDRIAGIIACGSAVGVALFPTAADRGLPVTASHISYFHFGFAAILFATLIYFSWCSFTKTHKDRKPTDEKRRRNKVYRGCAVIMALCMVGIVVYKLVLGGSESSLAWLKPVYWLESIAVVAFGVSWLTKGETVLFKDK